MENKWIKEYLAIHGVALDQRIERSGGGQYLVKFLEGFANDVKAKVMKDVKQALKSVSEEFDSNDESDESWKLNLLLNNVCVKLNSAPELARSVVILKFYGMKTSPAISLQNSELNYLRLSSLGERDIWDVFTYKRDCIEMSLGEFEHLLKKQNGKKS